MRRYDRYKVLTLQFFFSLQRTLTKSGKHPFYHKGCKKKKDNENKSSKFSNDSRYYMWEISHEIHHFINSLNVMSFLAVVISTFLWKLWRFLFVKSFYLHSVSASVWSLGEKILILNPLKDLIQYRLKGSAGVLGIMLQVYR